MLRPFGLRPSRAEPAPPASRSDRERLPAPAFAALLRVLELEPLLLEGVDVVERGAVQVQEALRVHVDPGPFLLEDLVLRARPIAELDDVGEAGASAAL